MIRKKSRRYLYETARAVAKLHNDAVSIARRLRTIAGKVNELERELALYDLEAKAREEKDQEQKPRNGIDPDDLPGLAKVKGWPGN